MHYLNTVNLRLKFYKTVYCKIMSQQFNEITRQSK